MKYYWFNKICCVPGCGNTSTEGKGCVKEYFDLPAEPQARAKWLKAVLTKDGENLKVCEDHFKVNYYCQMKMSVRMVTKHMSSVKTII